MIAVNTLLACGVGLEAAVGGLGVSLLDVIGLGAAVVMAGGLAVRAARNLRTLAEREPARPYAAP